MNVRHTEQHNSEWLQGLAKRYINASGLYNYPAQPNRQPGRQRELGAAKLEHSSSVSSCNYCWFETLTCSPPLLVAVVISPEEVILNFLNNKITIVNGYFLSTSLVDVTKNDYFKLKPLFYGLNLVYTTFRTPGHPFHEVNCGLF